jgi:hypothetical protein
MKSGWLDDLLFPPAGRRLRSFQELNVAEAEVMASALVYCYLSVCLSVRPSVANVRCFNSTCVESVSRMPVGFVTMLLAGQNSSAGNRLLISVLQTSLQDLGPTQSRIHCTGFLCRR